ncbi:MAG: hypothetical protein IKZ47_03680 [Clostridia bacterium]|nr:hypothetical protein [Clostridia bacterium]
MKKHILIISLLAAALFILPGFKSPDGFSLEVGDPFAVASSDLSFADAAERLGITEEQVTALFGDSTLKFIAVSPDKQTQIKVYSFEDELSSRVKEADKLTDTQIKELSAVYGLPDANATVITNNSRKFAKTETLHTDSGGKYTLTQFITVADGKIYIVSCSNPEEGTSEEIETVFSTFGIDAMNNSDTEAQINSYDEQLNNYKTQKILVTVLIIAVCGIIALAVFGIIRKLYKNNPDFENMG